MNLHDSVYTLHVIDVHGNTFNVHGTDEQLRPVYEEWRDSTFDSGKLTIKGFSDNWKRTPVDMVLNREMVQGMVLAREV